MMSNSFQIRFNAIVLVVLLGAVVVGAQVQKNDCRGPIYEANEVAVPAKIIKPPDFTTLAIIGRDSGGKLRILSKVLGPGVLAHVVLEAVLCRSGQVTDIKVTQSEPPDAVEVVKAALVFMTFKPAEFNWHTVSQRQRFDLTFNEAGISKIDIVNEPQGLTVKAPRRLTEEVDIIGNRRLTKDEVLAWVKTRPGEPYDSDQVNQDLQVLLKTGQFNALSTRVQVEDAVRGGVRVIFEVAELPLISEISFGRVGLGRQAELTNEFTRHHVDLRVGKPFDVAELRKATKVIEDYYRSQGWLNVKAEASVESLTATKVKVIFSITGSNF